ncbi:hypothetical protein PIB30_057104 [Stylosanthes scabra]|uniref:Uncharacterized protein n=1 Tax=Stylosanthes scabra TaxID=79078 RepID=A0ABU6XHJ4_9FABA|nr:hypothetical protein [Stylosanthes scabra]
MRENWRCVPTAKPSVIYKIISRQTAPRRLNNKPSVITNDSAVDEAAVVRSGGVVAFSDGLAIGNDSDGLAVGNTKPSNTKMCRPFFFPLSLSQTAATTTSSLIFSHLRPPFAVPSPPLCSWEISQQAEANARRVAALESTVQTQSQEVSEFRKAYADMYSLLTQMRSGGSTSASLPEFPPPPPPPPPPQTDAPGTGPGTGSPDADDDPDYV